MPEFRAKAIVVEAIQYNPETGEHLEFAKGAVEWYDDDDRFMVCTAVGDMFAWPGDWIIRLPNGDYRTCKAADFPKMYEAFL